jgi:hypothetical protein
MVLLSVVALPWYVAVGVATKGEWLRGFFGRHHYERFTTPLEGHGGGLWYHPAMLLVGFAPWSVWLVPGIWAFFVEWRRRCAAAKVPPSSTDTEEPGASYSTGSQRNESQLDGQEGSENSRSALRFLGCWCGTWLIFFSLAQTKLPNYVAPIYPALAILTGWWTAAWLKGRVQVARWMITVSMIVWGLIGVGVSLGLLLASGLIPLAILQGRTIPDLAWLAWLGVIPVVGAIAAWSAWRSDNRQAAITSFMVSGVSFIAVGAALGPTLIEPARVSPRLAQTILQNQSEREIRVACYGWFQPSIVFYVRRPVANLREAEAARAWLDHPLESYLIVSRPWWEERLAPTLKLRVTVLAGYWDFTRRREVLVIVNRPGAGDGGCRALAHSFGKQQVEMSEMVPRRHFWQPSSGKCEEIASLPSPPQQQCTDATVEMDRRCFGSDGFPNASSGLEIAILPGQSPIFVGQQNVPHRGSLSSDGPKQLAGFAGLAEHAEHSHSNEGLRRTFLRER